MKKISINRCARSGGGAGGKGLSRDRIDDVRFSSYSLQAGRGEKKWKLITSSLTPEPEEGSIVRRLIGLNRAPPSLPFPRVFLLFFFFFPLFSSYPPSFLIFSFFFRDRYERDVSVLLFFFWTHFDDTQRRMIALFVVAKKRGERDRLAISRTKFFSRCLPVEKGFISTLRRKSRRRFEDSRVNSKRIFILE